MRYICKNYYTYIFYNNYNKFKKKFDMTNTKRFDNIFIKDNIYSKQIYVSKLFILDEKTKKEIPVHELMNKNEDQSTSDEKINELNKKISELEQKIENIKLIPGPAGPPGKSKVAGPRGKPGLPGARKMIELEDINFPENPENDCVLVFKADEKKFVFESIS